MWQKFWSFVEDLNVLCCSDIQRCWCQHANQLAGCDLATFHKLSFSFSLSVWLFWEDFKTSCNSIQTNSILTSDEGIKAFLAFVHMHIHFKNSQTSSSVFTQNAFVPLMTASSSLFPSAALHPGPPDGSDHQDLAVREEGCCHVFPDDLLLPAVLDALCCCVHDGGLWQEEHGLSNRGHHPLLLCQVQHSLQPPHLRVHEQKGL